MKGLVFLKSKVKLTKKLRFNIVIFFALVFLYILLKYSATYFVVSAIKNLVDDPIKDKVKFSSVSFEPITLDLAIKGLNFDKDASLGKMYIDLTWSDLIRKRINAKFQLNNFDLSIFDKSIIKENFNIGQIKGRAFGEGYLDLKGDEFELDLDLKLQNLFLYSKNLEVINYFTKELEVKNLKITSNSSFSKVKSPSLSISNLILSAPSKSFKDYGMSEFAKIEIGNINVNSDKKNLTTKGFFDFKDGGFFALNKYKADSKDIMDIKVSSTDLTQFSSAFEPLLNYQIKSGKMSLDVQLVTDSKEIRGNVKINLSQLGLDSENEVGKQIENQSLMPLRTAIFFIQDDNGNIDLDFDLHGDKNDPNFSVLGILGRGAGSMVISKINSIVATKVAVRFAPILVSSLPISPSNVYSVASGAYKMVTKPRFKDIEFDPLTDDIKKGSRADLGVIVDFLKENKQVKINVCPVASTVEFGSEKKAKDKVLSLANDRVDTLNDYFKNNNKNNILKQVIFCRPKVSNSKEVGKAIVSI